MDLHASPQLGHYIAQVVSNGTNDNLYLGSMGRGQNTLDGAQMSGILHAIQDALIYTDHLTRALAGFFI